MKAKDLYAEYTHGIAMEAFSASGIKPHSEGVLALIEKSIAVGRAEGYAQGLEDAAIRIDAIRPEATSTGTTIIVGTLDYCAAAIRALKKDKDSGE